MRAIIFVFVILTFIVGCRSSSKLPPATPAEVTMATGPKANPNTEFIRNMRQLTFEGRRAGEGYFSVDGKRMIFQSERDPSNPFYQIYLMDLASGETKRVSPGQGKTSCSWIHPDGKHVLFASTHADPDLRKKAAAEWEERKNPKSRYNWSFDETYDIFQADTDGKNLKNLTHTKGYDAEGSYSPDGKWIAFASNRAGYTDKLDEATAKAFARDPSYLMDIYVMRADGTDVKRLTTKKGYDGGPFFSPDGKRLTFRRFSEDGHSAEIYTINVDGSDEKQLTRLNAMSWAPFYHPSGDYLIFATNKEGFSNFELYLIDTEGKHTPVRASYLNNFDGLPVFTPDGRGLAWTHSNENNEAQIYRADWNDALARGALDLPARAPSRLTLDPGIRATDAAQWVEYLANPAFEGRMTGSPQEKVYAEHLAQTFAEMGFKPGVGNSFLQTFEFTSGIELLPHNNMALQLDGETLSPMVGQDWMPLSYSKVGEFPARALVFAGYGIVAPALPGQPAYDSFRGLDLKNKWVVVFGGIPDGVSVERRFHLHMYSRLEHKAMMARQHGALGIIVIDDAATPATQLKLGFEGRDENAGLPVVRLSSALADQLFKAAHTSRAEWTKKLAAGDVSAVADNAKDATAPPAFSLTFPQVSLSAQIDLEFTKSQATNVIAKWEVPRAQNAVMIGAHMDHLGHGERGGSLSKQPGLVHPGADDNASGVAGVLEIAQAAADRIKRGQFKPKQNLYFALWTGEEIGVLGSNSFTALAARPAIGAYLNLDMVGRWQDALIVQGIGSASEWGGLIERANMRTPLTLRTQEDPYLPTDALSLYMVKIPSISFFTGSHAQYHTSDDRPELLNYEGIAKVATWIEGLTEIMATSPKALVNYRKVEGSRTLDNNRGFRLFLGTIPDYTREGKNGVWISGTSKDSPAEKAGLLGGDLIVELGGLKIQNLNDYVYCLQALKANEKTKMRIVRAGTEKELEITPALKSATP